jgi:hypothetical protein
MARTKKEIEMEIAKVVKTLPAKKQAEVLDFAKRLVESEKKKAREKQGEGSAFLERLATEGLYDGDGIPYDYDDVIYELNQPQ